MSVRSIVLATCIVLFLSSCSATPELRIVKGAGVAMELNKPASYVISSDFSPDDKYALSGSVDNLVTVWDLEAGRKAATIQAETGGGLGISALSMSPDGKHLLTGMKGGGWVKLWDAGTWKEVQSLPGHSFTEGMIAFGFSSDGKYAVTGGQQRILLWDARTWQELNRFSHNGYSAMAFSLNARLAVVKGERYITLWDVRTGEALWSHQADSAGSAIRGVGSLLNSSVKFSPGGDSILSGEGDVLIVRDARSGRVIRDFADEEAGGIAAVAFSPDGRYALSGSREGMISLRDVRTGATSKRFTGQSDAVASVAVSKNGRLVLSSGDGSTRLWDVSTGQEIVTMIAFDENEWLVITPEGYYNTSENGAQYLTVIVGENRYGVDRFYDVFYRPDIVASKLRGDDIRDLVTITMKDAIKSPAPAVEIDTPKEIDPSRVLICYRIKSTGGGIGEVRLFHNGKLIRSDGYYREMVRIPAGANQLAALNGRAIYDNMRAVSVTGRVDAVSASGKSKGDVFTDCREIEAVPGENEVGITAFNGGNTVQSPMKTTGFKSNQKPQEPHLYILAVGLDRYRNESVSLKYAAKDARDIEKKLKTQAATLYGPRNIHFTLLTDHEATKANITGRIDELAKAIKPQDSFILFVAGHGMLLQNQYYMLTHDFEGSVNSASMISSNEIVEMSKKIKSLSQLFIFDTCHAGGVDAIVSGLYDARMSVLAKKMGLHVYASASDQQAAMDGYRGNGLFTYTLLDGLNNNREADRNKDGKVTVVGLGEYAKSRTVKISGELGHSQTPLIINFGKDTPLYRLE